MAVFDSVRQVVDGVRDALTVRRVFGDPIERDGITVIPVARVRGGAGGGGGEGSDGTGGGGTGFGMSAIPVGVFVVRDGKVTWQPVFDLGRVILGGQIVAALFFLVVRSIVKRRPKRQV